MCTSATIPKLWAPTFKLVTAYAEGFTATRYRQTFRKTELPIFESPFLCPISITYSKIQPFISYFCWPVRRRVSPDFLHNQPQHTKQVFSCPRKIWSVPYCESRPTNSVWRPSFHVNKIMPFARLQAWESTGNVLSYFNACFDVSCSPESTRNGTETPQRLESPYVIAVCDTNEQAIFYGLYVEIAQRQPASTSES